ncbi:MAG: amidohydrolase [Oscillospiraceae bacterium]|nr:amidohydrolase [Oscillospiraceae bacterium]
MVVYKNARFISCEPENRFFSAMAVDKGRIVWVGSPENLPASCQRARVVDLQGAAVTPAFADTHIHFESFATFQQTFYLMDAESFDEDAAIVRAYADAHPRAKVLMGYGCSAHTVREGRLPERADMDSWTDRPLMVVKYDGHAAVCNSAMLSLLTDEVKNDPGYDGESGWLYQNAFYKGVNEVTAKIPILDVVRGLSKGAKALADVGIGLVHNVEGVGYTGDLDVDMINILAPGLPQAYRIFFQTMDLEAVKKRKFPRVGGCFKLALDGCFGSEDAALTSPYANDPNNVGVLYYSQEEINDFVIRANRMGLQIAMHAIGDRAVEQAVTAYEAAMADYPREDARHVLIHCCMATPEQLDRIARLKLCVAVQSPFIFWKQEPQEYLDRILGPERAGALNPLGQLQRRGVVMGDGSDGPCTMPNPLAAMANAVSHPDAEARMERLDALRMITYNPAYMSFDEHERGSLTEGKIADFVVLSDDPLTAPDIRTIQIQALYLAGKKYDGKTPGVLGLLRRSIHNRLFRRAFI